MGRTQVAFENIVLRIIVCCKREEETGSWRTFYNE
jgi:hypothetical protein